MTDPSKNDLENTGKTIVPSSERAPDISVGNITGTQGNVHVGPKYGIDKDAFEKGLENLRKEILENLANSNREKTAEEIYFLKQQLAGVEAKLADTEKALADRAQELAETRRDLESERLKNIIPQDQLLDAERKLEAGDSSSAETLLEKVLQDAETQAQAGATAAFRLGKLAEDRIDYRKALEYFEKAVQLAPENAEYLNEVGLLLVELGQYDQAISNYEKALEIDIETLGPNHINIAKYWNNLGGAWKEKGEYDKAIEFYEKALESDIQISGPENSKVAIYWNNLGGAWRVKGEYDKAIEFYEKAFESGIQILGPDHPKVALFWSNLGVAWDSKGEYDKAIEFYEKAEASDLKNFGPNHP